MNQKTLGPAILSSVERLSSQRLKMNYFYRKGVQRIAKKELVPFLRWPLIGEFTVL